MIGDPIVLVTCDRCYREETYGLTPTASGSWDNRNLIDRMKWDGWSFADDLTYCPDCTKINKEEAHGCHQ